MTKDCVGLLDGRMSRKVTHREAAAAAEALREGEPVSLGGVSAFLTLVKPTGGVGPSEHGFLLDFGISRTSEKVFLRREIIVVCNFNFVK